MALGVLPRGPDRCDAELLRGGNRKILKQITISRLRTGDQEPEKALMFSVCVLAAKGRGEEDASRRPATDPECRMWDGKVFLLPREMVRDFLLQCGLQ